MKIGIAVTTTPNREKVFNQWYEYYSEKCPELPLYIEFDETYKGVAKSKNKCLSALYDAGCDHFFLFDDDVFIIKDNWYEKYISSGLNHACWNVDRKFISLTQNYVEYETPNGCMLYCTRNVLDVVGGWDTQFKGYGYDHVNWSDRIFNAGLTPARYIDVRDSKDLFRLANCESSIPAEIRAKTIPINKKLWKENFNSKEYKPFK
jgi:hypothetical protein